MALCTITFDVGYGAESAYNGQSLAVSYVAMSDNGSMLITTEPEAIFLAVPHTTHAFTQGKYLQTLLPNGVKRYVQVPATSTAFYSDLVSLDPATLTPAASPEAAWWAASDANVVDGAVVGDDLILTHTNGATTNAGRVTGALSDPDIAALVSGPSDTATALSNMPGIPRLDPTKRYRIISGPIRNDGAGWFAIDDAGHKPVGIDSVSVTSGWLVVNYASLGADFVVFASCWPDETLTAAGFTTGASVGAAETTLKVYRDFPVQSGYVYYDTVTSTWKRNSPSPFSNTFTYSTSTGKLVITHNEVPSDVVIDIGAVARAGPLSVKIDSTTPTTVSLFFYDAAGAVVTGTPTADHRVYVRRGGGQRFLVDASTIDTVAFPSGNFWFYAIMQVP